MSTLENPSQLESEDTQAVSDVDSDAWYENKQFHRLTELANNDSPYVLESRWYPIGGSLDGQSWNLYRDSAGNRYAREVFSSGLGPLVRLVERA